MKTTEDQNRQLSLFTEAEQGINPTIKQDTTKKCGSCWANLRQGTFETQKILNYEETNSIKEAYQDDHLRSQLPR